MTVFDPLPHQMTGFEIPRLCGWCIAPWRPEKLVMRDQLRQTAFGCLCPIVEFTLRRGNVEPPEIAANPGVHSAMHRCADPRRKCLPAFPISRFGKPEGQRIFRPDWLVWPGWTSRRRQVHERYHAMLAGAGAGRQPVHDLRPMQRPEKTMSRLWGQVFAGFAAKDAKQGAVGESSELSCLACFWSSAGQ